MSEAVKTILSILGFVMGLSIMFGIMKFFGIDVVGTIMDGLNTLRDVIHQILQMR